MDDDALLSLEDDGGRPVDTLLALAELARAVRSAHAHLSAASSARQAGGVPAPGSRQTAIAQMMLRDALVEINGWCAERRGGAALH